MNEGRGSDGSAPLTPAVADSQGTVANSTGRIGGEGASATGEAASPRVVLLEHLLASMRDALAAGDLAAARIAHEAAGKLLVAPQGEGKGTGAKVVDLAHERGKRGRS